ncbi:MAG: pyridoxamine 5'-phosphate oxidase family protein [Boseongicola sp.]|nr:MAG: pyridoxamine 5'-phosphate oxidase family protein [Boseongicola sp.]
MGTQHDHLEPQFQKFIKAQPIFFTGTAAATGKVNVSPKGMDSLRILGPNRIVWRNLTGSGNESAAHVDEVPRMTIMWCSFSGPPMILRAFATARSIHLNDPDWEELNAMFEPNHTARQIFDLDVDMVQKSCGYAVPEMTFEKERDVLTNWGERKSDEDIRTHWLKYNQTTLDGFETHIAKRNIDPK